MHDGQSSRPSRFRFTPLLIGALGLAVALWPVEGQSQTQPAASAPNQLRPASGFSSIADPKARALALFTEAGKVLLHPRCVNCHPAGDRPLQTERMTPHIPLAVRGDGGMGPPGMHCTTCHGQANFDAARVPGHPEWHLAPIEMAWEGRSLGQICEQIKDVNRNGGKDMAALLKHSAEDTLVGYGWAPGKGREPAPGTQAQFGELMKAWADSGAHCPS